MSEIRKQIVAILFSDLAGYSAINNDDKYTKISIMIEDFIKKYLNTQNHFYHNIWGDGIIICSYDPHDILEIALYLRDWFENKNWKRLGFDKKCRPRIGIHVEKVNITFDNGNITDVVGKNIIITARIEPIVNEGCVYCTQMFYNHVINETEDFAKFINIGIKKLAKNFTEMELYEVKRFSEVDLSKIKNIETNITITKKEVKIKKEFSDIEKKEFELKSFQEMSNVFKNELEQLKLQDSDVKYEFNNPKNNKITCMVYVRGKIRAKCQIWVGEGFNHGIHYSTEINEKENSSNETFFVETDGFTIYLKTIGMLMFNNSRDKKMNGNDAGLYLWNNFIKTLEY